MPVSLILLNLIWSFFELRNINSGHASLNMSVPFPKIRRYKGKKFFGNKQENARKKHKGYRYSVRFEV